MRRKVGHYAVASIFAALLFLFGVVVCEMAFRAIDGFDLLSLRIPEPPAIQPAEKSPPSRHLASVPLAPGMKAEWFELSPKPLPRIPDPHLRAATDLYATAGVMSEATHVFNSQFASKRLCEDPLFQKFPNFLFLYDAPNNDEHPRYRFPLNAVNPAGLVTNQFGWRGPQVELKKAPKTIRIAFVGASTTVNAHGYPFSYPELAGFWLNKWSEEAFGVRVEAINAGREGIVSFDIAAAVRDEVLPLEPDLVVYYEGGNQFDPGSIVRLRTSSAVPPARAVPQRTTRYVETYSAFARRIAEAAWIFSNQPGNEPNKPAYDVVWPADVNENDPPLDHPALPSDLSTIVRDLDSIRTNVANGGGELVVASYFWLVYDGMKLDPTRHRYQLDYLNRHQTRLLYIRYREIERIAAFQNRVFKKYAAVRGLPFLNIASTMPRDPDLFVDAVHATYPGVRLFAWIAAQQLAPILQQRISDGRLPRPSRLDLSAHPAFPGNERTEIFDCDSMSSATRLAQIQFSQGTTAVKPATVQGGDELLVSIPKGTAPFRYAALVAMPPVQVSAGNALALNGQIKVSGGGAVAGILSADEKRFLASQSMPETNGFVPLRLRVVGNPAQLGSLVVSNGHVISEGVTVQLRAAELFAISNLATETYARGLAVPPKNMLRIPTGAQKPAN
jgi:hypothetical protein